MSQGIPDLWPEEIQNTDVLSPLAIMRYQAGQLSAKTKNMVEAEVRTESQEQKTEHQFILIAPALDRYEFELFSAHHEAVRVYPVEVWAECLEPYDEASTQEEFMSIVGKILRSPETRSVIQSLIAQSRDASDGNAETEETK